MKVLAPLLSACEKFVAKDGYIFPRVTVLSSRIKIIELFGNPYFLLARLVLT